jgi:hypothetical protein
MTGGDPSIPVSVRMRRSQKARVRELADLHNLPVADYIRMKALEDPIERIS